MGHLIVQIGDIFIGLVQLATVHRIFRTGTDGAIGHIGDFLVARADAIHAYGHALARLAIAETQLLLVQTGQLGASWTQQQHAFAVYLCAVALAVFDCRTGWCA